MSSENDIWPGATTLPHQLLIDFYQYIFDKVNLLVQAVDPRSLPPFSPRCGSRIELESAQASAINLDDDFVAWMLLYQNRVEVRQIGMVVFDQPGISADEKNDIATDAWRFDVRKWIPQVNGIFKFLYVCLPRTLLALGAQHCCQRYGIADPEVLAVQLCCCVSQVLHRDRSGRDVVSDRIPGNYVCCNRRKRVVNAFNAVVI